MARLARPWSMATSWVLRVLWTSTQDVSVSRAVPLRQHSALLHRRFPPHRQRRARRVLGCGRQPPACRRARARDAAEGHASGGDAGATARESRSETFREAEALRPRLVWFWRLRSRYPMNESPPPLVAPWRIGVDGAEPSPTWCWATRPAPSASTRRPRFRPLPSLGNCDLKLFDLGLVGHGIDLKHDRSGLYNDRAADIRRYFHHAPSDGQRSRGRVCVPQRDENGKDGTGDQQGGYPHVHHATRCLTATRSRQRISRVPPWRSGLHTRAIGRKVQRLRALDFVPSSFRRCKDRRSR